jgi:hypothetical protein
MKSSVYFLIFAIFASASYACNNCGRDGRDGRDGTDGKDGKDGKNGHNGLNGKDGTDGRDGKNGINGLNGKNGKNAVRNWRQCAWKNVNDGKDNGIVKTCGLTKISATTYLKIVVATNMRIYNCNACCKRWFVTINGKECQYPTPIDGVVYMRKGTGSRDKNLHRPRVIRGACKFNHKGRVNIALNVGNCPGYKNADAYTGWNSSTNIYIEEMDAPSA